MTTAKDQQALAGVQRAAKGNNLEARVADLERRIADLEPLARAGAKLVERLGVQLCNDRPERNLEAAIVRAVLIAEDERQG